MRVSDGFSWARIRSSTTGGTYHHYKYYCDIYYYCDCDIRLRISMYIYIQEFQMGLVEQELGALQQEVHMYIDKYLYVIFGWYVYVLYVYIY
jgi:hypothetical protein